MKIENIDRAEEIIRKIKLLEETLRKVDYALEKHVGTIMSISCYGRNGYTKYKEDISIYPPDICKEETESALTKYKECLEYRIGELKKEIEKL